MHYHKFQWLKQGFELVIEFVNNLQVKTVITLLLIYTFYNHFTLIFPVYFHQSSLSASWQWIYNTGTIEVSLNHTLPIPLYYSTHRSSIHTLNLHRSTSNSSSTTNFLWLSPTDNGTALAIKFKGQNYMTTDDQSASLSWDEAPILGLWPDLY
jgi:hypothetical protein